MIHHSQIGVDFIMLYVMIEALHIPFILIADLLYTYVMQFSTCYCGYRSYGCRHTLIFTLYRLVWAATPLAVSWGNDSCQLHFLILFVRRNSISTFGLITHNRTRKTHTKAHNIMDQYTTATTLSIIAHWPPNNTNSAIDILIGESYGYSVVGARLMAVEHGHWGRKEIWS